MQATLPSHYETLPYPDRDPADEARRLVDTWLDALPRIDHYAFAGRQSFRSGFRVLVAGGGTGDATIYLAEQLRGTDARIVHLDTSARCNEIARARAQRRGLANIEWVQDSLLALPRLGLGPFDYVNCSGVLQQLEDPDAGLQALLGVLAEGGAMGVMVHAAVGRAGVRQMQALMQLVTGDEADPRRRIATAREVLRYVPQHNAFRHVADLVSDFRHSDAALYDLLLQTGDRAYTVEELHAWFEDRHGLSIELTDNGRGRMPYEPAMLVGPARPAYLAAVEAMPARRRHAIGELLGGFIIKHSFYAVRGPSRRAPYGDPDYVPFFIYEPLNGPQLSAAIHRQAGPKVQLRNEPTGLAQDVELGPTAKFVLKYVDGRRTFGEIFALVRQETKFRDAPPDDRTLFEEFRPVHDFYAAIDRLMLRHRSADLPIPVA